MEISQKSAIKYRRFDFIGKLYEDFKNLTNFNRTFFFSLACAIAAGYLILRGSGMFPEPSISLILLAAIFIIY